MLSSALVSETRRYERIDIELPCRLYVPGANGVQIPLSTFAHFTNKVEPLLVSRFGRLNDCAKRFSPLFYSEHHPSPHRLESPNGRCSLSVQRECTFPAVLLDRRQAEQCMRDPVSRRFRFAIRKD